MSPQSRRPTPRQTSKGRAKQDPNAIRLGNSESMPVLYEDRDIMAIDKPAGWMVTTPKWSHTKQNLQREIEIAVTRREPWVTRRQIKFLRFVHRLDRETSGVLLLAKNRYALTRLSRLFADQEIEKLYLCVVHGKPNHDQWMCTAPLGRSKSNESRMRIDPKEGQEAATIFITLQSKTNRSLVLAAPLTGRTHQIRVHLFGAGHSIIGDPLYTAGRAVKKEVDKAAQERARPNQADLALRAWAVRFFFGPQKKSVRIQADLSRYLGRFAKGFKEPDLAKLTKRVEELRRSETLVTTKTGRLPKLPPT